MGGALSRFPGRHQEAAALAGAALVLGLAAGAPLLELAFDLLGEGRGALAALAAPAIWVRLGGSLALALATTALALAIGVPMGVLVGRTDLPLRRLLWALHGFGMFLPPLLPALGWFYLLGRNGLVGGEASAAFLFGPAGLVAVLGITLSPVVTTLVALGVEGVDASLVEAARLVAGPGAVAGRILLPAAAPALALASLVVFASALSDLGVATFLRVDTYPAAVFARLGGVDYAPGEAVALALPLVPVVLGLLWAERRLVGRRSFALLGLHEVGSSLVPLGGLRGVALALAAGVTLVSLAPLAALAWRASSGVGGLTAILEWAGCAPLHGLAVAAASATGIAVVGLVVGHGSARGNRGALGLDALGVLAFMLPAAVLGVGTLGVWNRPLTRLVYRSPAVLVIALLARFACVGARVVAAAVAQTPEHLEEAAAVFGAGYARRLTGVVLPVVGRAVAGAWLLALVLCLRDLDTAILLYPPGGEPLPVRIFTLEANGPEPLVAGLALLHVAITGLVLVVGGRLLVPGGRR